MNSEPASDSRYTVIARRYRPQSFGDLVGQNHISHALSGAIRQNRIGHAYLFTGARGVGKTSSARIFAKCLNCVQGPTDTPCNECDSCQSVSVGEDIDVLEIDGASNRGIDEIRQLRSNAIIRPSRSRHKIYIIDEVHMLTSQAFNALLKTLEEPPSHVKFIFCTTDPQKIPITVLSRCQRFDFSPVQSAEIIKRLNEICDNEKIQADPAALAVLARRAGGSMRDSQSLLEQLFSFCDGSISIEDVHQLLGTADTGVIAGIADSMLARDSAGCLNQLASAVENGVDSGQLAAQLLGWFRDVMAIRVGANVETLLTCDESDVSSLKQTADALGLETILSIVQILDHCLTRMQSSLHGRTVLEVAIVRICSLENLDVLADLIEKIGQAPATKSGSAGHALPSPSFNPKKKIVLPEAVEPAAADPVAGPSAIVKQDSTAQPTADKVPRTPQSKRTAPTLSQDNLPSTWQAAAKSLGGMAGDMLVQYQRLELTAESSIEATFDKQHVWEFCRRSDRSAVLESALNQITNQNVRVNFRLDQPDEAAAKAKAPKLTRVQMIRQLEQNALVKSAIEVFDAEVVEFRNLPEHD